MMRVMVKYVLSLIGIIVAGAFLFSRARPEAPVPTPREVLIHSEKSGQESRATTSAVSKNLSGAGAKIQSLPIVKKESAAPIAIPPKIITQSVALLAPVLPPAPIISPAHPRDTNASTSAGTCSGNCGTQLLERDRILPPLDEKAIFGAVVKIECPSEDRKGKYVASGFAMPQGVIVTAAHFIKDSGSDTCQVIFPRDRAPSIFLVGKTEDRAVVRKRHDEQGIDVAFIFMPLLASYPEARGVFPDAYPFIPYPVCADPVLLSDRILHYGYPSSFQNNSYLDRNAGTAVAYADINGITEELSEDQTYLFKTPIFGYTSDQSQLHPYLITRSASFYGDSGGLGFNATRQCIIGPDRGGTIGGAAGENFSVFMVLGWDGVRNILP
ncbi:MAG: hypothetical protein WAP52_01585 [Candidatus Sungiibacteriota bacterium]